MKKFCFSLFLFMLLASSAFAKVLVNSQGVFEGVGIFLDTDSNLSYVCSSSGVCTLNFNKEIIGNLSCSLDQIPKYNGTNWTCSADATCNGVSCDLIDSSLINCDSIDTDASGNLICGADNNDITVFDSGVSEGVVDQVDFNNYMTVDCTSSPGKCIVDLASTVYTEDDLEIPNTASKLPTTGVWSISADTVQFTTSANSSNDPIRLSDFACQSNYLRIGSGTTSLPACGQISSPASLNGNFGNFSCDGVTCTVTDVQCSSSCISDSEVTPYLTAYLQQGSKAYAAGNITFGASYQFGIDTVRGSWDYHDGTSHQVLSPKHVKCGVLENPTTSDTNVPIFVFNDQSTIKRLG
ncbi:hypothetical protein D6827_00765, partial [Candidatus Parcubacteria bacterium]